MAAKTVTVSHLEIQEMSIDEDELNADWRRAVGLNETSRDEDALTARELMKILNVPTKAQATGWAERGIIAGRVIGLQVYRDTGNGYRWQRAYRLLEKE